MCGIVGLLGVPEPDLSRLVATMKDAVAHRGPDSHGTWTDPATRVGLGHHRLSIIDLSSTGHQPMQSRDERWVVVVNGEIYDHTEHRAALRRQGTWFRGSSDVEVLVELIAQEGVEKTVQSIEGMFALAAWDRDRDELWLARDRMGEKPLYYGMHGGRLSFASELHAIRRLPWIPTEPDPDAIYAYLELGYIPSPLSIIPGVHKLPAGHLIQHALGAGGIETKPYWRLERIALDGQGLGRHSENGKLVDALEGALRSSVRRRLVADVPVGVFLSGGLDSSTIAALATDVSDKPVQTFTVSVGGQADESTAAESVAAHLGTSHTTIPLPSLDPVVLATDIMGTYDEPFADPSAIPTLLLCRAAREHVTVALSGDGADELLGGYNRHRVATGALGKALALPRLVRAGLGRLMTAVPVTAWDTAARRLGRATGAVGTKAHKLGSALRSEDSIAAYQSLAALWSPESILTPGVLGQSRPVDVSLRRAAGLTTLGAVLLHEQLGLLPDNMLVKTDRASMRAALEIRVPFLDHRVVELTWRVPDEAKIRSGEGKWLERQVLGRYVPRDLWDRPKIGFDPPLAEWLRGPLKEWASDLLSPASLARDGILRPEPVQAALAEHLSGRANRDYSLWTALMLTTHFESVRRAA